MPGLIGYLTGAIGHENIVADCDSQVGKILETETSNELKRIAGYNENNKEEWK